MQELLSTWLSDLRPASTSPHVFPGLEDGRVTAETTRKMFKNLCTKAGLTGPRFHPHALRHYYAHLLLGTGNSVDFVSKCMNHSNSSVTESFYLEESPAELLERANISWLSGSDKETPTSLPSFLDPRPESESISDGGCNPNEQSTKQQKGQRGPSCSGHVPTASRQELIANLAACTCDSS